jgi:hypothetical protein
MRAKIVRKFRISQSGGESKTAAVQITGIGSTLPVNPSRRLQRLLRPMPPFTVPFLQTVSSRSVCCLAAKLVRGLIEDTIKL